jgi:tetratricopeptide (TPR) repeat protein
VGVSADHQKRLESRLNAYEYCMLVHAMDPTNSMALVHMANHCSHTWKLISGAPNNTVVRLLPDRKSITLRREDTKDLAPGDQIRVNFEPTLYTVAHIDTKTADSHDIVTIVLDAPVEGGASDENENENAISVEAREFGRALRLAAEAYQLTADAELRAEAYYIMGKVNHMQGRADKALACYRKSLAESEFMLSAFGAAQIQLSRHELASAYDLFERVFQRFPDDKDTKAYFFLVKALHKKEATPMEQLKDVCVGFQFEADLWMLQGQLRFDNPNEFHVALKCLTNALDCLERKGETPDSLLLSNIAVLQHSMGRYVPAAEFGKRALVSLELELVTAETEQAVGLVQNPPFRAAELDGVFYSWKQLDCEVYQDSDGHFNVLADQDEIVGLAVGADIVIADVLHKVTAVHSTHRFDAASLVRLPRSARDANAGSEMQVEGEAPTVHKFAVKIKQAWHNFLDNEVTMSYNFARMLEDVGATSAAIEIYVELLKKHPSYMECYLRLSRISRDMGRYDEASMWLSRALAVNEADPDVNVCLGDLYARNQMWDEAKKIYEKICSQKYHDTRAMLSLGNFYFTTLSTRDSKYEAHLKDSYKFFHHVLNEDHKNVYAANGLGMICAEKKELEVAREIFSRVCMLLFFSSLFWVVNYSQCCQARETNMSVSDEICINLAHVHYAQGRFLDAEHQYQATLRAMHSDRNIRTDKLAALCEYSAMSQFSNKRHDESIRSLLRAIHYSPLNLRLYYNVAIVRNDISSLYMQKPRRSVADIEVASEQLNLSQKFFLFLGNTGIAVGGKDNYYDKEAAQRHARLCEVICVVGDGIGVASTHILTLLVLVSGQ